MKKHTAHFKITSGLIETQSRSRRSRLLCQTDKVVICLTLYYTNDLRTRHANGHRSLECRQFGRQLIYSSWSARFLPKSSASRFQYCALPARAWPIITMETILSMLSQFQCEEVNFGACISFRGRAADVFQINTQL